MPKKRTYRKGKKLRVARFSVVLALGTLVSDDLILVEMIANNSGQRAFMIAMDGTWSVRGLAQGEGPINVGIAHGDYAASEVEAWFESTAGIGSPDKLAQEVNGRLCREVGKLLGPEIAGGDDVLNDGKAKRTKLRWLLETGNGISVWARNESGSTLTTGAQVEVSGKAFYTI